MPGNRNALSFSGGIKMFDLMGERICIIPASIAFWGQKAACQGQSPETPNQKG